MRRMGGVQNQKGGSRPKAEERLHALSLQDRRADAWDEDCPSTLGHGKLAERLTRGIILNIYI